MQLVNVSVQHPHKIVSVSVILLYLNKLDMMHCVQTKRRQIISTLIATEKCYVETLRRLCEV